MRTQRVLKIRQKRFLGKVRIGKMVYERFESQYGLGSFCGGIFVNFLSIFASPWKLLCDTPGSIAIHDFHEI